jgi:hypothetical protein
LKVKVLIAGERARRCWQNVGKFFFRREKLSQDRSLLTSQELMAAIDKRIKPMTSQQLKD